MSRTALLVGFLLLSKCLELFFTPSVFALSLADLAEAAGCDEDRILCVDSCTGNILDEDGSASANPTFTGIDRIASIRVRVIGHCADDNYQFVPSVTYRAGLNSLTKPVVQPAAVAALAVAAPAPPATTYQLADFFVSIAASGNDYIAEITVERKQVAAAAAALPVLAAGAPADARRPIPWSKAHAEFILNHGRYYVDFGVGLAAVLRGTTSISAAPVRGDNADLRLTMETSTPLRPLFSAFVYPCGHARGRFTPFGYGWKQALRNLLVVQLATELSRAEFLRTVYLGVGLELVSGFNIVAGGALVPVTVHRSGAQPGIVVADRAEVAGMTRDVNVVRFYLSMSVSTELLNAAKSAYALVSTP